MHIHGPAHAHAAQPINPPHRSPAAQPAGPGLAPDRTDQVDISPQADLISRLREIPDVRTERVAQIQAAIESGVYETQDKLDVAIQRLAEELG